MLPPSLLFLLFLPCLWAIKLLVVFEVVCCCAHTTDGAKAHIYFMTDIWNQALNSSMLYLLEAAAGENPSPSLFLAASGSSKSSFTFHSSSRQSFIAIHFPVAHRMDTVYFCVQRFTLRCSSDSDSAEMRGKKRKKIIINNNNNN